MKIRCISSIKANERFFEERAVENCDSSEFSAAAKESGSTVVELDPNDEFQTLIGFGGAFTEAGAYTLSFLSEEEKRRVVGSFFGTEGIGYSLCRTHIQSCDFSLSNYSYIEDRNDAELATFSIKRDALYLIPFIKAALACSKQELKILASPWSPPAHMKTNDIMNRGGSLRKKYRRQWAQCIVKYIKAYAGLGIPIWGITAQNEPEAAQIWDSCLYSAEDEAEFIAQYLHPALQAEQLFPKIIIWDHNRDRLFERASTIYDSPYLEDKVWGAGFHWYEELAVGRSMHEEVQRTHQAYPHKHLLLTEAAQELQIQNLTLGSKDDEWKTGERYARNIIGDLNAWAEGWIDWNMILNAKGGPNHAGNYCDAAVRINTENSKAHYSSIYYFIGHFSKFIEPGAVRIAHSRNRSTRGEAALHISTWKKDKKILALLMNDSDEAQLLCLRSKNVHCALEIEAHSIHTLILEKE